jgi:aspartyl-tRNA synthetase
MHEYYELTICNTHVTSVSHHFPLQLTTVHALAAFTKYHYRYLHLFSTATSRYSTLQHPVNVYELEGTKLETFLHNMEQSIK